MKATLSKTAYSNFFKKSKSDNKNHIHRVTPLKPVRINQKPVSFHTFAFRKQYSAQINNKLNLDFWGCVKPPKIRFPHNSYFYPEQKSQKKLTGESGNLLNHYVRRKNKFYKKNMLVFLSQDKSSQKMSKSFHSLQSKQYIPDMHTKNPQNSIQYQTHNTELSSKYYNQESSRKNSLLNENIDHMMRLQELDQKIRMRKKMLKQFDESIQKIKYKKGNFFE